MTRTCGKLLLSCQFALDVLTSGRRADGPSKKMERGIVVRMVAAICGDNDTIEGETE